MPNTAMLRAARPSIAFEHEQLRVRVIWLGVDGVQGVLIVGRDGARLGEFRLPRGWGPVWIEVEGPFVADAELAFDEQLARAVLAGLSRQHDLLALVAERSPEPVRAYMRDAAGRWSARRLAELTRIPEAARHRAVARWTGEWGVPAEWVGPVDGDERERVLEHPIASVPWIGELSYRDIEARAREAGPLRWIDADGSLRVVGAPPEVLRLDASERRLLLRLIPGALEQFDLHAWARREPGGLRVPDRLDGVVAIMPIEGRAGERGLLGLAGREVPDAWGRPPRHGARMRVLVRGHELEPVDIPLPLGPFVGVIEVPGARALPHSDRVGKDDAWRAAAMLVESAAQEFARAQLHAWMTSTSHQDHERERVREWLLALERGDWPELGARMRRWQATLDPGHPLRIDLP